MDYVAIHLEVNPKKPGSDILISNLAEIGFESFVETEIGVDAFIGKQQFDEKSLAEAIQNDFFKATYVIEDIPHRNWNQKWEDQYDLVVISKECVVRAPFHPVNEGVKYDLIIQPQMSFGTGHHPTTELMLKEMLNMDFQDKKVLDMGSGTGVLAVLAEKKGAIDIVAIEIDEHAAINCKENIERNNCIHVDVENGDSHAINGRKFDVIFANINLNVLLGDIELYVNSLLPQGHLLLSGFYDNDQQQLIEPLQRLGLVYNSAKHIDHWTLLHFLKPVN